jgi:hypothetical protein
MSRAPCFAALACLFVACTAHDLAAPNPRPEGESDQYVPLAPNRKVDVLFMVDNSLSMKEEQDNLARNFPAFIDELRQIKGGLPDVHIGVVTSDLGAGPSADSGCAVGGQGGRFQGWDKGCGLDPGQHFIVASEGEKTRNYQGDLARVFGCMAQVGTSGCGYEHQIASTLRALTLPENAGFLRDDAFLQIILISDEDDCSAPPDSPLFTMSFPDEEPSYRCARAGHLCQGRAPGEMDLDVPLDQCQPSEHGGLIDVATFIDQVRALKTTPDRILVSGIFGWPTSGGGQYRVGRTEHGHWDYLPACQSANGEATAALRMKQFVDAFGANGTAESICAGDFRPALQKIADRLKDVFHLDPCVPAAAIDSDPAPGLQPDCVVNEVVSEAEGARETTLPRCDETGARPCWRVEQDPRCEISQAHIAIDPALGAAGQLAVKCRVCGRADDPRCAH